VWDCVPKCLVHVRPFADTVAQIIAFFFLRVSKEKPSTTPLLKLIMLLPKCRWS